MSGGDPRRPRSRYEAIFEQRLARESVPAWELEFPFSKAIGRKHRVDFAWPAIKVGAEVDGGGRLVRWQTNPRTGRQQPVAIGRHGTKADLEKLNIAAELGWRIFRFNPDMLKDPAALGPLIRTIQQLQPDAGLPKA